MIFFLIIAITQISYSQPGGRVLQQVVLKKALGNSNSGHSNSVVMLWELHGKNIYFPFEINE